jgi:hypothetical protein
VSDQQEHADEFEPAPEQHEQLSLLTKEERVKREVAIIFGRHQLVNRDTGGIDFVAVADTIYPVISAAVVENPGDRAKVGITPTHLVDEFFADVPGPAAWAEYGELDSDEYKFHEEVYKQVKREVFRVLSINPDGLVQSRLGANGGTVLCRMKGTGGREEIAYVTRNRKCINDDNNAPAIKAANAALRKAAALAALAIERVSEHKAWFATQYRTGAKETLDGGNNMIRAALDGTTDLDDADDVAE